MRTAYLANSLEPFTFITCNSSVVVLHDGH